MKIDKGDEQKLKNIFEVLKNSQKKIKGYITINDVIEFRVVAYEYDEKEFAKSEFRRLSKILNDLKLAKLKLGISINEDELYITPETLTTNIEDVFKSERNKERKEFIISELNKYNLSYTKYILKTKYLPYFFTSIGLIISIFTYLKDDCTCQKEQIDQKLVLKKQNLSSQDSLLNFNQSTTVKSNKNNQP